jgi:hypothetical protein
MKTLCTFIQGFAEFRQAFTPHFKSWHLARAYDQGRELAHRCTFRHFEN